LLITSDHGEGFLEHSLSRSHVPASLPYNEIVKIPLIFYSKNIPHKNINTPCSSIDIAPTLLDLLNINIPKQWLGKSFKEEISSDRKIENIVFSEGTFGSSIAVVKDNYKLINFFNDEHSLKLFDSYKNFISYPQLFNLKNDPHEKQNLFFIKPDISKKLLNLMESNLLIYQRGWNIVFSNLENNNVFNGEIETDGIIFQPNIRYTSKELVDIEYVYDNNLLTNNGFEENDEWEIYTCKKDNKLFHSGKASLKLDKKKSEIRQKIIQIPDKESYIFGCYVKGVQKINFLEFNMKWKGKKIEEEKKVRIDFIGKDWQFIFGRIYIPIDSRDLTFSVCNPKGNQIPVHIDDIFFSPSNDWRGSEYNEILSLNERRNKLRFHFNFSSGKIILNFQNFYGRNLKFNLFLNKELISKYNIFLGKEEKSPPANPFIIKRQKIQNLSPFEKMFFPAKKTPYIMIYRMNDYSQDKQNVLSKETLEFLKALGYIK